MDCSLPSSSVHGLFWARLLEWVALSLSRGSSQPRDQTHVSTSPALQVILYHSATREAHKAQCLLIKIRCIHGGKFG